jgi:hypothetical protein
VTHAQQMLQTNPSSAAVDASTLGRRSSCRRCQPYPSIATPARPLSRAGGSEVSQPGLPSCLVGCKVILDEGV